MNLSQESAMDIMERTVNGFFKTDIMQAISIHITLRGGAIKCGYRRWYNPVRYFKGGYYVKYIAPEKIYKEGK